MCGGGDYRHFDTFFSTRKKSFPQYLFRPVLRTYIGMPISLAGSGLLILIVEGVLGLFGITPEPGSVAQVLNSIVVAGGWLMLIAGQVRRKDLIGGIVRRFSL